MGTLGESGGRKKREACRDMWSCRTSGILVKGEGPSVYETEGPSALSVVGRGLTPAHPSVAKHCVPARTIRMSVSVNLNVWSYLQFVPSHQCVLTDVVPFASVLGFPFPFAGVAPVVPLSARSTGSSACTRRPWCGCPLHCQLRVASASACRRSR